VNLLRTGNISMDSMSEQPTRISAVQFQEDVIDHEDKREVLYFILHFLHGFILHFIEHRIFMIQYL